ncbi:carboxylesterase 4A [Suncus etruscus]|uniref:carboxylesterase 4A n=1 Tax=Suncus etruscus TaxID=109475 RepID=UPI00210FA594|nr:carboxylesterase 4A [Suncus etruscus]
MHRILCLSITLYLTGITALGKLHSNKPLVATKYGVLQGKQVYVQKMPVNVFLGIPFSKPPLGARRFAAPEPPEPWEGIRTATSHPPSCLQESWGQVNSMYLHTGKYYNWMTFSEDCLYLNVYAPVFAPEEPPIPVMVWFPGGAFLVGSASTYDGSQLAAREKVVVVILQYRLGILGFLSTGDSHARGNWALLDQILALHWVQENIRAFGGDPGLVTLFGESSGAFCVSGLMLSPLARGLFHRAISQSGTALVDTFITPDPLKVAKKIAQLAGCQHNNTQVLVSCLRDLSGHQLMRISKKMNFFHFNPHKDPQEIVWFLTPVVDGVVLLDNPMASLSRGQVAPVPYLLGINSLEFSWSLPYLLHISLKPHNMNKETISKMLWSTSTLMNITKEQLPIIVEKYLGQIDYRDLKMIRKQAEELVGDITFVYATLQTARYHRNAGFPVYLYELERAAPCHFIHKPPAYGADHADDIHYVFGSPFSKGQSTSEERMLSRQMMKYWANFARTGNPNDGKLPYWPPYDKDEKYLQLDFTIRVGAKLKEEKMAFLRRLRHDEDLSERGIPEGANTGRATTQASKT